MKEWGVNYTLDDHITFQANYVHIREKENRLLCSLEGEFLKDDKAFDPPMNYQMKDVGITSKDLAVILMPIYHLFKVQREAKK